MGILTNEKGLPEPIFRAIEKGWYDGDPTAFCSASTVIKSPKEAILLMRHGDEIVEDASSKIWSLLGSAVHKILEVGEGKNDLAEERLSVLIHGKKITGKFDIFIDGVIHDYKVTSVWTLTYNDDNFKKWTEQLNIYAYMLRQAGFEVKGLQVNAILRDWSTGKAEREWDYPKTQVQQIKLRLWSEEEQLEFLKKRVGLLLGYINVDDDDIPVCSPEDRWEKPSKYALMKKGRKSAVKVYGSKEECQTGLDEKSFSDPKNVYYMEERPSIPLKCKEYCPVKEFCNFWKENHEKWDSKKKKAKK